jgi:hypothetical protein
MRGEENKFTVIKPGLFDAEIFDRIDSNIFKILLRFL